MSRKLGVFHRSTALVLSCWLVMGQVASVFAAPAVDDLFTLSLEDLFDVKITTASKVEESSLFAPATIYVVTAEQISKLGLRDLKDIMRIVPGVDVIDPHFFLLGGQRGFSGSFNQTLILVNGREMNNLIAGETFISNQFMAQNIRQVEIINGPGSALYGANAVAGIINIITKDADPNFEGLEASASYGSFESKTMGAVFGQRVGEMRISGSLNYYKTDGEDFAGWLSDTAKASPRAENNAYRWMPSQYGYRNEAEAVYMSLRAENKGVYVGTEFYQNQTGRGTSGIQWDYNQGEDHRELWMAYAGYERKNLWQDRMDIKAEYRHYVEKFWGNHTEGEGPLENPYTEKITTFDTTWEDIEAYRGFYSNKRSSGSQKHVGIVETTLRLVPNNTLVAGVQYENAKVVGAAWGRTAGPHPYLEPEEQWPEYGNYKVGVYAQDQAMFFDERLGVTLGARYDHHERYDAAFNPRCGLVYRPFEESIFKLLYGKSFREPTVFEIRNSQRNIEPMTLQTVEFGWHQFLGKNFKNEAVVYYNHSDDLIVADSTEIGGTSNGGELKSHGFENQLGFRFGDLNGFANYTFTKAKLETPEEGKFDATDVPEHKANLAVMYDFFDHFSAGFITRYRGSVDTKYYGETIEVDDYLVCDLTISAFKLPWFDSDARLDLIFKNVFDTKYYDPEPRAPSVIQHPQEGSSFFVKLTVKI